MACVLLQYAYFIVFMILYVDQGNGRLKKTTKDTLKHDLKLYKKIIEKIDSDLIQFEEEYPNDPLIDQYQENIYLLQNYRFDNKQNKIKDSYIKVINNFNINGRNKKDDSNLFQTENTKEVTFNATRKIHVNNQRYTWPKFEDILLAMGKKYDWKNDRWIKIKNDIKDNFVVNKAEFHEKHNFKYRIVKLNRTKSKRNIVIAVTAVR